jgi:protein gp37
MPNNVWLGVSIPNYSQHWRWAEVLKIQGKIHFVSFEPLVHIEEYPENADWIIVGRLTGHGKRCQPKPMEIQWLVDEARKRNTPVFLKNNLKDIWPGPLIQEFPK